MADCIFCAIVDRAIPSTTVDEDELTYSFMDINPATPGHVLVIPKRHSADLLSVPTDDLAACALTAQRVARLISTNLGADGLNVLNCCGAAAWQTVFHFHLHVVPRYADAAKDSLKLPWIPTPGDLGEIGAVAKQLVR
jgi:histidine triad (HIT) family protein